MEMGIDSDDSSIQVKAKHTGKEFSRQKKKLKMNNKKAILSKSS